MSLILIPDQALLEILLELFSYISGSNSLGHCVVHMEVSKGLQRFKGVAISTYCQLDARIIVLRFDNNVQKQRLKSEMYLLWPN